ncbi:hypothetical protein RNJ44_04431 [Nakaseomyces bracarensis]|uniref:AB hydrolase-1 domain-containing protein n=1 Tax=Nakaseomyces bracarensis TaxID=273131 RepID=A0ABR4NUW9_9SACH
MSFVRYYSVARTPVKLAYDYIVGNKANASTRSPIVILHGLFGNKLNNRTVGRGLNQNLGRDVYLVDLRNHGDSPRATPHDYEAMRLDIEGFLDEHRIANPIILGHSMGAKVAMRCCLYNPTRYSMLVSMENAPVSVLPNGKFVEYIDTLQRQVGRKITLREAEQELAVHEKNQLILKFLMTILRRSRGTGEIESKLPLDTLRDAIVKGKIAEWDVPGEKQYTHPSLFLRGTESPYIADEYIVPISTQFPNFELRDIKGGHYINVENSKACIDLISEFIDRKEDL